MIKPLYIPTVTYFAALKMSTMHTDKERAPRQNTWCWYLKTKKVWDFPRGPGVEYPPAKAGDTDLIPGLELRSHVLQGR